MQFNCHDIRSTSSGPSLSLAGARKKIIACLTPLPRETVSLARGLGRVPVQSIKSTRPKPFFDQSTRDGYALGEHPLTAGNNCLFTLIGEIAAGSTTPHTLTAGQAVRIMTGARLPVGCRRVAPFELCGEKDNRVLIPSRLLKSPQMFIRRRGQDLQANRVIAGAGKRLLPDHLLLLAENGLTNVAVHRQPGVAVLCTGSELVTPGKKIIQGQKVSGNGVLLQGLIQEAGGTCIHAATVGDSREAIAAELERLLTLGPDMIITTGGMGPGKFDLLEQIFTRLQGELIYNSLKVRPGKSTLFGLLAGIPFFGLPGPPPAVRLLFHELVAPAIYRLQGMRRPVPPTHTAQLLEPIADGKSSHLNLKGGVVTHRDGRLCVRLAGNRDAVNGVLHLRGKKHPFGVGDKVTVRLTAPYSG